MAQIAQDRLEALGPAERLIQTLTTMTDHMVHNRPGLVSPGPGNIGVRWEQATWVQEGDERVVYLVSTTKAPKAKAKKGKKGPKAKVVQVKTRAGILQANGDVVEQGVVMGQYRKPNDLKKLFPEISVYLYKQVADIFKMDNEFAAHWASYAFGQKNRDLKVILAAFMFVQDRCGEPVVEDGEVLFFDDDFRAVAEAMFLIKGRGDHSMEPKLLVRVGDVLRLPGIAAINRELGYGRSARKVPIGRYYKAVWKWLRYREQNPKMLAALVAGGQGGFVKALARRVHYKPLSDAFFEALGWTQRVRHGHRTIAIGKVFEGVANFEGLSEQEICQRIVTEKLGAKLLYGLMPNGQEMTAAMWAAAIDAGSLSDKDLIILTPTLEQHGLLKIEQYAARWRAAGAKATDQRAANVARNTKGREAREGLEAAADVATVKAFEEVARGLRVYCMVDKSASMEHALETAQDYLARFLGGFPLDKLHVSVFNTQGSEVTIRAAKRAAVTQAFRGHGASGGTRYAAGVAALQKHRPADDEDVLFLFVGDQAGESGLQLSQYIQASGLRPAAFGYLRVVDPTGRYSEGNTVQMAARHLAIPCFDIDVAMFAGDDPYAITRILRDMIASTPVAVAGTRAAAPKRVTLIEQILKTPLLERPTWADPA
jgi:hypothetical protein